MITMSQIAKLTQVSQPTVSRVLNGSQTVSPEIRERVLACARAHNYQCNVLAKGLQGSRIQLLGVLVTDIANGFFADLAKQLEFQARRRGYSILLLSSGYTPSKERECLDILRRYRVDGVLAVPAQEDDPLLSEAAAGLDFPLVSITRRVEGLDSVYLDHTAAGALVARHLCRRGYRRFLFIGQDRDLKYQGFCRELKRQGHEARSLECQDVRQLSRDLANRLRASGFRTAVFTGNDLHALQVLRILRDLDIAVPRQAGVIGFDNTFLGQYLNPALSSVSQPIAQMAAAAVSQLLLRLEQPDLSGVLDRPFPARLVHREST